MLLFHSRITNDLDERFGRRSRSENRHVSAIRERTDADHPA
jgi:hypothetical protein